MGFVSASDNIGAVQTLNQNENITISEKVYEIDDGNYDEYFGSVKNLTDEFSFFSQNISFCPV